MKARSKILLVLLSALLLLVMLTTGLVGTTGTSVRADYIDDNNVTGGDDFTFPGTWDGTPSDAAWTFKNQSLWRISLYVAKDYRTHYDDASATLSDDFYKNILSNQRRIQSCKEKGALPIMDKNFDIQEYLTRGVETVVAASLRTTLKDPRESAFMIRFAAASKKASWLAGSRCCGGTSFRQPERSQTSFSRSLRTVPIWMTPALRCLTGAAI